RADAPGAEVRAVGAAGAVAIAGPVGAVRPARDDRPGVRRERIVAALAGVPEHLLEVRLRDLFEELLTGGGLVDVRGVGMWCRGPHQAGHEHEQCGCGLSHQRPPYRAYLCRYIESQSLKA